MTLNPTTGRLLDLRFADYDLVVACAGYEPRCTHLLTTLQKQWQVRAEDLGEKLLLLGFDTYRSAPSRVEADAIFRTFRARWEAQISTGDGLSVQHQISAIGARRILVDYSCMSRALYLTLLGLPPAHEMTFGYSVGNYGRADRPYPVSVVGDIRGVPGLEGLPHAQRPRLFVLGLGYDGVGTDALVDKLEAQCTVVVWADPGASPDSGSIASRVNRRLITAARVRVVRDLRDVCGTATVLRRIAQDVALTDKVVFCPVGPKPQVLACGIAAAGLEHATVLAPHLGSGGIRRDPPLVTATGEVVVTHVDASQGAAARPA